MVLDNNPKNACVFSNIEMWFEGEKYFSKLSVIKSKFLSTLFEESLDFLFSFYKNDIMQLLYDEAVKEFAAKHVKTYYSKY